MAKTTPAPAAKTGIKKLNLGGIATKTEKTATEYPQLPASDDLARLVTDYLEEARELEAVEGSLEIKKAELKSIAQGFYFQHLHGKLDIPSSVEARGAKPDQSILIAFANRYKILADETPIIEAIGAERTGQFFRQAFELKVDGDKIPADIAEDLIEEIQNLFTKYNAAEALTAKAVIKPTSDFHVARHSQLSVSENIAVDGICPIIAMVKTKGRRK